MLEIVDGRTDDGRTPEHGYTISSPCEPNGSGELKIEEGVPDPLSPTLLAAAQSPPQLICALVLIYAMKKGTISNAY